MILFSLVVLVFLYLVTEKTRLKLAVLSIESNYGYIDYAAPPFVIDMVAAFIFYL